MRGQSGNWLSYRDNLQGDEEFLNRIVETLGIIIDGRPKGRPRKMES